MTYALAQPLQVAVYQRLSTFPAVTALVGAHVYDAVPPGLLPPLYVALGPETARDRSDATAPGAEHDFVVSVVAEVPGFSTAKAAAAAACDALADAPLALSRGRVVSLRFLRAAAARRGGGETRQIDLIFRARLDAGA